ncbi:MAG: threonine ammonia-lyase [Actinomycetota bacterium]
MADTERGTALPTYEGVRGAGTRIGPYLEPTPLRRYPGLERLLDAEVWVKHENHLPTGAFKVRGGVNLASQLTDDERVRGLIAASTGNHGQSIAFAARLFGVAATICVPEGANEVKVRAMEDLGARIVTHGRDFDDAREHCQALAQENGYRYVHSGNEVDLIEGVGTYALEILDTQPDIETVVVPIGGGSGAAGTCIAGKGSRSDLEVIGVQAAAAPAAYRSWKERRLVTAEMKTAAEGLATRTAFELPQRIMWRHLDDFVLVSEDEIRAAIVTMIDATRNLVEAAGASPLAAALKLRDRMRGRRVALVCSGGNITVDQLREAIA